MCSTSVKVIATASLLFWSSLAICLDTSQEEKVCSDIGFKKKTPAYGECVLELAEGRKALEEKHKAKSIPAPQLSYKSSPARLGSNDIWDLRKIALSNAPITYLKRPDGTIYETVRAEDIKSIVAVANTIGKSAGITPALILRESNELNAGATYDKEGRPLIILNKPMMDLIKNDPDMAAALLGHEMAHLYLNHSGTTAGTNAAGAILGAIAGIALEVVAQSKLGITNLGIRGGNLIGVAFSTSFTRDQERDADKLGIQWAKQNGYDPQGGVRLFQILERKNGNNPIPFFQSHPNPSERIENARQFSVN
jgi:Zn-dependent protease with chaperone function